MTNKTAQIILRCAALSLLTTSISACNVFSRLSEVGDGQ